MNRVISSPLIFLSTLALLSCGGPKESAVPQPASMAYVKTETMVTTSVPDSYEAVGTVRSRTTSLISARTMGNVSRVAVSEGDRVRSGQLLIEIDNRDAAVQVRRAQAGESEAQESLTVLDREITAAEFARTAAEANRTLAASTFERYRALHDRRSISDQEFDEVQARLRAATAETERAAAMQETARARRNPLLARIEQAKAERAGADLYLEYSRVVSPSNGIVVVKSAEVGMNVQPGQTLLTIEDDAAYRLEVPVPESQSAAIHKGSSVRFQLDAAGTTPLQGNVAEIVPQADPATHSIVVKIDLPPNTSLRSGLFGRALFPSGERQAISVPAVVVSQRGQLTSIYVLDGKTVHQRLIKLGRTLGDRVEVLSGLQNGDLLIVEPRENLVDGTVVVEVRQ